MNLPQIPSGDRKARAICSNSLAHAAVQGAYTGEEAPTRSCHHSLQQPWGRGTGRRGGSGYLQGSAQLTWETPWEGMVSAPLPCCASVVLDMVNFRIKRGGSQCISLPLSRAPLCSHRYKNGVRIDPRLAPAGKYKIKNKFGMLTLHISR